jgi:hypothetical protein
MTYTLDVPQLVELYQAGHSVAAIARVHHVDSSVIRANLVAAGVTIRGPREATAANLARDPAVKARMGRPRIFDLNPTFFDTLSADSSYVVGLLQADGSNQRDRGIVCITLKLSDIALLERLSELFAGGRPLFFDGHGNPKLMVQNRQLSDGLARRGVVSPKTHTAKSHPALVDSRDYWRGVVDGDGTLCTAADGRRILSLVGSRWICEEFLAFCQGRGAGLRRTVRPHKSIYSVHLSGRDAELIARELYRNADLALARKAATAAAWEATP